MTAEPTRDLPSGTLVAGRYRVVGKLGEGGMGAVYRAVQEPLGREVALKLIAAALAVNADAVARFHREAKAASALSHPNIVTVYDFGADGTRLFLAMELLSGEPLDALVARGPTSPARVIHICRGVCAALAEAHARGIVHRDLKPQNVMLASTSLQRDIAKVVDFGIAKMKDQFETATGAIVGTPGYVAPELFDGKEPSPRSDLYALGVVAYELLCGQAPFQGKTPMEVIKASLFSEPPPTRAFVRDVPPELEALLRALLAKNPDDRPASAADVDARLAALLPSASTSTPARAAPSSSPSLATGSTPAPNLPPSSATEMAVPTPAPIASSSVVSPSTPSTPSTPMSSMSSTPTPSTPLTPSTSSSSSPLTPSTPLAIASSLAPPPRPRMSTGAIVGLTLLGVFIGVPVLFIGVAVVVAIASGEGDDAAIVALGEPVTPDGPPEGAPAVVTGPVRGGIVVGGQQVAVGVDATTKRPVLRPLAELLPDAGPTPESVAARMRALGIGADVHVNAGGDVDVDAAVAAVVALAPRLGLRVDDRGTLRRLLGVHPFTVQWVGVDAGAAVVDLDDAGLTLQAEQETDAGGASVVGRVVAVDASGFVVDGVATWIAPAVRDGACTHQGRLRFEAKSDAWRLKPAAGTGCPGLTDHFDIYFNKIEDE